MSKKVIDMKKIKVGDVVETWNDGKEFITTSKVDNTGYDEKGWFISTEEQKPREKIYIDDVFAHYRLVDGE